MVNKSDLYELWIKHCGTANDAIHLLLHLGHVQITHSLIGGN